MMYVCVCFYDKLKLTRLNSNQFSNESLKEPTDCISIKRSKIIRPLIDFEKNILIMIIRKTL